MYCNLMYNEKIPIVVWYSDFPWFSKIDIPKLAHQELVILVAKIKWNVTEVSNVSTVRESTSRKKKRERETFETFERTSIYSSTDLT